LICQAVTLYFGLVKNNPWFGGNKRTATPLVDAFLIVNGVETNAEVHETIDLVLGIESSIFDIDDIEKWLRLRTHSIL
jgi:prophage maintenance system killer protein